MIPEATPRSGHRLAREDADRHKGNMWQLDPLEWHLPLGKLAMIRHGAEGSESASAFDSLWQEYESVRAGVTVESPLEEWDAPDIAAVYAVGTLVSDLPGFNVVDRIRFGPLPYVEHRLVPLNGAQARFLAERAEATGDSPGTVLSEIIALVMGDDSADSEQEDNQSVRAAFGDFANRYPEISKSLLESDPDLRTSVPLEALAGETTQTASATYADQVAESPSAPELSDADLQQAFSEFANEYPVVCERIFGEPAALSAHLGDQHIRAQAVLIPEQARTGEWAATVADLLDHLRPPADKESALRTYIVHLRVDTDEPLEGPAIIFPSSSHWAHPRDTKA